MVYRWKKATKALIYYDKCLRCIKNIDYHDKIQDEMGDVLFSVVNLARFLDIDPEASLRQTIRKFESRFKKVEKSFENSEQMSKASLDQMDKIWNQAKEEE